VASYKLISKIMCYNIEVPRFLLRNLHGTFKAGFIVFLLILVFIPIHGWAQDENAQVATVSVNPSELVVLTNATFTVNISISNVSDMAGWQIALLWNRTVINCTEAVLHAPSEWTNGTLDYGPGIMNDYDPNYWVPNRWLLQQRTGYNSTFNGIYFKAQTYEYPEPSFNGSVTIVTLTFQTLQPGNTSLQLRYTELANSSASPIPHTDCDAFVNIIDANTFTNCFGLQQGDKGWNAQFDFDGDGKIDIYDAIILAGHSNQQIS
jgi:hypothetical protein